MIDPVGLKQKLSNLQQGDHTCFLYKDKEEQVTVTVLFLLIGLERNEQGVFLADPATLQQAKDYLVRLGVDVELEIKRKALSFISDRLYLQDGKFYPQNMLRFLEKGLADCVNAGFTGLRATGDVMWELGTDTDFRKLYQYEVMLDYYLDGKKIVGLCQYRYDDIPPHFVRHSMTTHPHLVYHWLVCRNHRFYNPALPYQEKPQESEAKVVSEMFKSLLDQY
ncbi:MAG: MEDS domain-containing protein [Candidatus Omnitrophica bacterium]|nr:MEDS domain-containing protein [Candidatus Omnitrophota bacterium]